MTNETVTWKEIINGGKPMSEETMNKIKRGARVVNRPPEPTLDGTDIVKLQEENDTLRDGLRAAGNMIERLRKAEAQSSTLVDAFIILAGYWEKRAIAAEARTMQL